MHNHSKPVSSVLSWIAWVFINPTVLAVVGTFFFIWLFALPGEPFFDGPIVTASDKMTFAALFACGSVVLGGSMFMSMNMMNSHLKRHQMEASRHRLEGALSMSYICNTPGAEEMGFQYRTPEDTLRLLVTALRELPQRDAWNITEEQLRVLVRHGLNAQVVHSQLLVLEDFLREPRKLAQSKGLNDVLAAIVPYLEFVRETALMNCDPDTATRRHYLIREALEKVAPVITRTN
ncbi:hypothetical protein HYW18_01780 [Candidatus Uhrbacteria bacterium]|nr:hypothetical protein [Candidatus Uhrbacteria bacterium]